MERLALHEVCRLCRASSDSATLVNIFEQTECEEWEGELEPNLLDMIRLLCAKCLILPGDELPQNICLSCKLDVTNAFRFKRMCEDSHLYYCKVVVEIQEREGKTKQRDKPRFIRLLKCEHCSKEFRSQLGYSGHMKKFHSGDKKNDKCFTPKRPVTAPVQAPSAKESFKCTKCPQIFNRHSEFKTHLFTHQDRPYYNCLYCPKSFLLKEYYQSHMDFHERQVPKPEPRKLPPKPKRKKEPKPEVSPKSKSQKKSKLSYCSICDKSFVRKSNLDQHMEQKHSAGGFKCYLCSQHFATYAEIHKHLQNHKKEKETENIEDSQTQSEVRVGTDINVEIKIEPTMIGVEIKQEEP